MRRDPLFLSTYPSIRIFVYTSLILSLASYARFVYLVIGDITNYLGIACFTVRKKGKDGVWRSAVPREEGEAKEAKRK
jgi:ethanolaminephosphotransferase